MFTGIVEETGIIREIEHGSNSSQLTIEAVKILDGMKVGDSINVNGICLTVTAFGNNRVKMDVMAETLRRTNFKTLATGSPVNLERALRLMDRLGGHLVSGHVDGTGKIVRRWVEDTAIWFSISADSTIMRYIVDKGSVCIDGISLTIASLDSRSFSVSIIPHTQNETTLLLKKPGNLLNIECDIIAKYIEKLNFSGITKSNIDLDFLAKNNFL